MNSIRSKLPFPGRSRKNKAAVRLSQAKQSGNMEATVGLEMCKICHDPVGQPNPDGETETWSALPCGHEFGARCIKRWLGVAEHPACPTCRSPMVHTCGHSVLPSPSLPMMPSGTSSSIAINNNGGMSNYEDNDSKGACYINVGDHQGGIMDTPEDNNHQPGRSSDEKASMKTGAPCQKVPVVGVIQPQDFGAAFSRSASWGSTAQSDPLPPLRTNPSMPSLQNTENTTPPQKLQETADSSADLNGPCSYCLTMLKLGHSAPSELLSAIPDFESWQPIVGRIQAFLDMNGSQFGHNNALWEEWRSLNDTSHGAWWAAAYPPTEQPIARRREYWQQQY